MIDIDGSVLEGGGQVLRMAMAFSGLKASPIRIRNIRAGRAKKGLASQHVCGLNLVKLLTNGSLTGSSLGSSDITFKPSSLKINKKQDFYVDIKTAGATTLLAQVSLPLALFRPIQTTFDFKGGTNAEMAPSVDYYEFVFRKLASKFGATFDMEVLKRGYFPKGGGHLRLAVHPLPEGQPLKAVTMLDPGESLGQVVVRSHSAGNVSIAKAERMALTAKKHLIDHGIPEEIVTLDTQWLDMEKATGNGSSIFISATSSTDCVLGATAIGSPKKTPEETGLTAANDLLKAINGRVCVDEHAQDQVIIWMALAQGCSRVLTGPLTLHTKTAIFIAELMTKAKFNVVDNVSASIIECEGIGYVPNHSCFL